MSDRRAATLDGVKPGWCGWRIYANAYLVRTGEIAEPPPRLPNVLIRLSGEPREGGGAITIRCHCQYRGFGRDAVTAPRG